MRITKKMLSKSNERKNVVIFILLAVVFVLSMVVSVQFNEIRKSADQTAKTTQEIKNILTLGVE